jgi:hypothetical protein
MHSAAYRHLVAAWIPFAAIEFRIRPQVSEACGFVGMIRHSHGSATRIVLLIADFVIFE